MPSRKSCQRRGSAYLVILGASLVIAALAYSAILVTRTRGRMATETADAAEARQIARAAIELGRLWISQDANWRTNRAAGIWASSAVMGTGFYTLEATDPVDGVLAGWPHDPLVLKATGIRGNARYVLQVTLEARPIPLQALQFAAHTAGEVHVHGDKTLNAVGGTISTNGELKNDGTIIGSIDVTVVDKLGIVTGSKVIGSAAKPLPASSIIDSYASVGTLINPGSTIDKRVLGPGLNPFGAPDINGIYVIRPTGDLTIKNSRILGTLVIILPSGKKVTFDNSMLIQPFRADMPGLLVKGNAEFHFYGGATGLTEASISTNLNPSGAPFNGTVDNDVLDIYPSEIQGLVHVTGKVDFKHTATIRGCLITNDSGNDAIDSHEMSSILYTPSLFTNPPMWYTTRVDMPVQRGTWRQLTN